MEYTSVLSLKELANLINNSFLEPMVDFSPLNSIDYTVDNSGDQIPDLVTPWSTYLKLIAFNPSKAPGPDNIQDFKTIKDFNFIAFRKTKLHTNTAIKIYGFIN